MNSDGGKGILDKFREFMAVLITVSEIVLYKCKQMAFPLLTVRQTDH